MLQYIQTLISEVLRERLIETPDFTVEHPKTLILVILAPMQP